MQGRWQHFIFLPAEFFALVLKGRLVLPAINSIFQKLRKLLLEML